MPRHRRQRRKKGEVRYVAHYDRQQSLEKIDQHRWFRHHGPAAGFDRESFSFAQQLSYRDVSMADRAGIGALLLPFFCRAYGILTCSNSPLRSNMRRA